MGRFEKVVDDLDSAKTFLAHENYRQAAYYIDEALRTASFFPRDCMVKPLPWRHRVRWFLSFRIRFRRWQRCRQCLAAPPEGYPVWENREQCGYCHILDSYA